MSKKEKPISVTRDNLLRVLKGYDSNYGWGHGDYVPPNLIPLVEAENLAVNAFKKFRETDHVYMKLEADAERASEKRNQEEQRLRNILRTKIRKVRNAVYTRGPTPAVIKMVEDLVAELG